MIIGIIQNQITQVVPSENKIWVETTDTNYEYSRAITNGDGTATTSCYTVAELLNLHSSTRDANDYEVGEIYRVLNNRYECVDFFGSLVCNLESCTTRYFIVEVE